MSADDDGGPGRRETAQRLFAAEFDDATHSYSESDEERAPNYVVAPTGARVNRLFAVGVLTEVESVSEDVLRGRIVDPTGAFVLYAGQYQPDALAFLERTEPPAFVAVTGKARTFQPEDSDAIYTSVRPESLNEVDAETRDRWVVTTAERTIERIDAMRDAKARPERGDELEAALREEGVATSLAAGIPRALSAYGTTDDYLDAVSELSLDAVRVVAGEREEAGSLPIAPDEGEDETGEPVETGESDTVETERETSASSGDNGTDEETASVSESGEETQPTAEESASTKSEDVTDSESDVADEATETDETAETVEADESAEADESDEADESTEPDTTPSAESESGDDPEAATDEMYEFDEEERQQVEEEHGLEFSTGDEVEETSELGDFESGLSDEDSAESAESESETAEEEAEADSETDDSEPEATETEESEPETDESESETTETEDEGPASESSEPDADFDDPEEAAIETMTDLGDGDAVERGALVDALTERYGVTDEDAEDAIEDALMSGRCYESGDGELTPI